MMSMRVPMLCGGCLSGEACINLVLPNMTACPDDLLTLWATYFARNNSHHFRSAPR